MGAPTLANLGGSDRPFEKVYEQAEQLILQARLQEAAALLQAALAKSRAEAAQVRTQEQKQAVRGQIRAVVLMKFTCDLALQIAQLKDKLKAAESQFQKKNLTSSIASVANVLILLNLPGQMRLAFFKFAVSRLTYANLFYIAIDEAKPEDRELHSSLEDPHVLAEVT